VLGQVLGRRWLCRAHAQLPHLTMRSIHQHAPTPTDREQSHMRGRAAPAAAESARRCAGARLRGARRARRQLVALAPQAVRLGRRRRRRLARLGRLRAALLHLVHPQAAGGTRRPRGRRSTLPDQPWLGCCICGRGAKGWRGGGCGCGSRASRRPKDKLTSKGNMHAALAAQCVAVTEGAAAVQKP